jgi:antitoxin HigA-1
MSFERTTPAAWAVHPGEIVVEEFLKPMQLSAYALAKALHMPQQAVNEIVRRKRGISPDTALRLSKYFGTTAEFWMNLQASYELAKAARKSAAALKKIKPRAA